MSMIEIMFWYSFGSILLMVGLKSLSYGLQQAVYESYNRKVHEQLEELD